MVSSPPARLRPSSCCLCGAAGGRSTRVHPDLVRCACGLRRNRWLPVYISDSSRIGEWPYVEGYTASEAGVASFYAGLLGELAPRAGARLLDVGCSIGVGLDQARRRGLEAAGVEPDARARARARARGFQVWAWAEEVEGSFDYLVLNHVLEHLPDPPGTLRLLRERAAPGARLFIGLPSGAALWSRVQRERWCFLELREHLWFFDPGRLARLVEAAGWRTLSVRTGSRRYPAQASAGRLKNAALGLADRLGWGECVNLVAVAPS